VSAGENRQFEEQRLALVKNITTILKEENICASQNDCNKKGHLFVSPGLSGLSVKLYGVNSNTVFERITKECLNIFFKMERKMSIVFGAYQITKDEDLKMPFWKSARPNVVIKFKGDK
jgi:hypothetical protein